MNERNDDDDMERRVLVVAPTTRDGEITRTLLATAGLSAIVCSDLACACEELRAGAGALLMTAEALASKDISKLLACVVDQPSWSDLPIILQMQSGQQTTAFEDLLPRLGNVTLLERPAPSRSVVSALRTAVRGRQRQYQIRDHIAASVRAAAHARQLQEQLALALEASELGTFHCPLPLGKIEWNAQSKAHFGLSPDAQVDLDAFYSFIHPDDREQTRIAIEQCVYGHQPYDVEFQVVLPDGNLRWIRATGKTAYDAANNPMRFDGTTEDVTERKEVEQALLESRAQFEAMANSERLARAEAERVNQMKDEFLATLSHELRTPLNAIFGWAQILKMEQDNRETIKEAVDVIDRNVRLQTQLIEDLLDMSRVISGKIRLDVQQVDLAELIDNAIESVRPTAEARGLRLERIVNPCADHVSGDPGRLQQVLWNLLTNAIKFTPEGGKVQVVLARGNSHVELSVVDTGEGIDAEFLPYLFERFSQADASTTRKHGGLGLGLSIVKTLVELHGGAVRAKSAGLGQGSTFTIHLPLQVKKAPDNHEPQPRASRLSPVSDCRDKLSGLNVLIVDDEPDARALVSRFLVECSATTALAASAAEAHMLLSDFAADVIVSDIGMPEQDGYDFIRARRKRGDKTPAVALTAFARAEDRMRSIQAGFQSHLPKPVEPAELIAVVASLAGRF
jgi:PAS domain S-box-containing protein